MFNKTILYIWEEAHRQVFFMKKMGGQVIYLRVAYQNVYLMKYVSVCSKRNI